MNPFLLSNSRRAWTARGFSLPLSTYAGKSAFFGLLAPAADHGELLEL